MHAVALRHALPRRDDRPQLDEPRVRALAAAAGVTPYELGMRLRVLDGSSGVLATFAGRAPAESTVAALEAGGVRAWVIPGRVDLGAIDVRRFSIAQGRLGVVLHDDGELDLAASDVRMLVHGVLYREAPVPRSVALPTVAGSWAAPRLGLSSSSSTPPPRPEPFVLALVPGLPPLAFRAATLRYGLLDEALAPTRSANFGRVVQRLREACPAARYDERLRRFPEQARVLGPTLRPERYLDLAITLVMGMQGASRSPYR